MMRTGNDSQPNNPLHGLTLVTPWAREKVEASYLRSLEPKD